MENPLVSIIVPTKNSGQFLERCLKSIQRQTYKNRELIVVDNASSDNTREIAKKYTKLVFIKGPERSTQRNYGALQAKGEYLLFIDSDMELTMQVVKECVEECKQKSVGGVILPEESVGKGFWAKCMALEKSFYLSVLWIEAARFFPKKLFEKLKGFDETLVSGEDWDLSQRIRRHFKIGRIASFVKHNEGDITLMKILRKKFYYAREISKYISKNKKEFDSQSSIFKRYTLFFSHPKKLFSDPLIGVGMLFLKTSEFAVGAIGYIIKK